MIVSPSYALFGTRLYAYLIDQSIIQGAAFLLLLPFCGGLWKELSGALSLQPETLMQASSFDSLAASIAMAVLFFTSFQFALGVAYGTLMEGGSWGATLGKKHCGLCVTNLWEEPIGYGMAAIRNIGINLFVVALSFDVMFGLILVPFYLLPLVTKRKQAWHDIVAQTIVIRTQPL